MPRRLIPRRRDLIVVARGGVSLSLICLAIQVGRAGGQEHAPEGQPPAAKTDVEQSGHGEAAPDHAAQRRAYSVGIVMLGGILICGVGLIAAVLLWGNRTRRIARQPLPKVAPVDELWYLKGKKTDGVEPAIDPVDETPTDD
ncbi:MAG: hypothetical protein EXS05_17400 [Planctomycetaceae bacterium]|nr:hypothetical protein [Planctomycetaceae bacterium]